MKLSLIDVSKTYADKVVLDHINYDLEEGVYGLLGANGAGKTTLMHIICKLLKLTTGRVEIDNKTDMKDEEYYSYLGFLPQDFKYYPEFSATDFMIYMALLKGLDKHYAKQEAERLLKLVALEDNKDKKIKSFSGGMKQRLGIAQALIGDPKILILDEPTVGLDPKERVRFRNLISGLSNDKIIILSTHIVSDVEYIADEILILKDGEFKEQGKPSELLALVKNRVWEVMLNQEEFERLSPKLTIVNQRNVAEGISVRIVSDNKPLEQAQLVDPVLEDLYLYYFGGQDDNITA